MATDLCISLVKFSYATGQRSDNTIPWAHVQASDLFMIVKSAKDNDGELTVRVMQGNSVLESIDVSRLIDESIEARHKSQQAGIIPQVEQLPIFGMAKHTAQHTVLALRYRQEDGQARRVQFRMQSLSDCIRVANFLENRGMEFRQQKSNISRQDTPRPSTAASQGQPSSMQSSSPFFQLTPTQPTRPDPFSRPPLEAGSLSGSRPTSPIRPVSGVDGFQRPPDNASQAMPPPRLFTRDENVMPREVEPNRPTTAQIYRSSTTPYLRSLYDQPEDISQPSTAAAKRQLSASLISDVESIQQSVAEYVSPPQTTSNSDLQQDVFGLSQSNHGLSPDPVDRALQPAVVPRSRPPTANLSAPYTMATSEFLQHELPLRRELLFARPGSHLGADTTANIRPTSASLTLPPLPRPKSVRKDTSPMKKDAKRLSENVRARPATASPAKRSFDEFSEPLVASEPFTSESRLTNASISPSKTSVSSYPDASPPKLSPMNELLARKKPLLQRSANAGVPRLDSLADAPYEIVSPPSTAASPARSTPNATAPANRTQLDATENGYVRRNNASVTSMTEQERSSLEAYAVQSQEDRAAAIDDFVMANLENPAFTKLCGDVENCWRRFALGL